MNSIKKYNFIWGNDEKQHSHPNIHKISKDCNHTYLIDVFGYLYKFEFVEDTDPLFPILSTEIKQKIENSLDKPVVVLGNVKKFVMGRTGVMMLTMDNEMMIMGKFFNSHDKLIKYEIQNIKKFGADPNIDAYYFINTYDELYFMKGTKKPIFISDNVKSASIVSNIVFHDNQMEERSIISLYYNKCDNSLWEYHPNFVINDIDNCNFDYESIENKTWTLYYTNRPIIMNNVSNFWCTEHYIFVKIKDYVKIIPRNVVEPFTFDSENCQPGRGLKFLYDKKCRVVHKNIKKIISDELFIDNENILYKFVKDFEIEYVCSDVINVSNGYKKYSNYWMINYT